MFNLPRNLFYASIAGLLMVASFSPAQAHCGKCGAGEEHAHADIIDTAVAAGSFNTLVAAVRAADLVDALKGEGPFTVFAPTDEAFAALPEGTVENLLKPENKEQLVSILTYHVVSGAIPSSTAITLKKAEALNDQSIELNYDGEDLMINDAKVVKEDIEASNGVIHVIDKVLIPATPSSR